MIVIFAASSDEGSADLSSRIIGPVVQWLFPEISIKTLGLTIFYLRKCAHLAEYAVLSILLWVALPYPKSSEPGGWPGRKAAVTLIIVFLYAMTDEFHQTLVPTRQGNIWDVLIDTFGGALGLSLVWVMGRLRKRW